MRLQFFQINAPAKENWTVSRTSENAYSLGKTSIRTVWFLQSSSHGLSASSHWWCANPEERVLDVACGAGMVIYLLGAQVVKAATFMGLYVNSGMLAAVRSLRLRE